MHWLPTILSILIAAAGVYYLLRARTARGLVGLEQALLNSRRIFLRRLCGALMLLLAGMLYLMLVVLNPGDHPGYFVVLLLVNLLLLLSLSSLALLDMRLTFQLRRSMDDRL